MSFKQIYIKNTQSLGDWVFVLKCERITFVVYPRKL
jgi:hypothetical protein